MPDELFTQPLTPNDDALDRQVRLFLDCRPLIQAHIASLVRDPSLAEDVFQEVWLRFERVTRHGAVIGNVLGWCRSAARLVALESWRKQHREQPIADAELAALVEQAYAEQDGREDFWTEHQEALGHCLDALPPRSRELISRRYRDDHPISDIAANFGQSIGSVKTALCRLRIALSACVRKRLSQTPSST